MKVYCYSDGLTHTWKGHDLVCVYCGSAANTSDHVPPKSVRQQLSPDLSAKYPPMEVSCCFWCNSALGARTLWTLQSRKQFIARQLRDKFAGLLASPRWSEADLEGFGGLLRARIESDQHLRADVERRLRWAREKPGDIAP